MNLFVLFQVYPSRVIQRLCRTHTFVLLFIFSSSLYGAEAAEPALEHKNLKYKLEQLLDGPALENYQAYFEPGEELSWQLYWSQRQSEIDENETPQGLIVYVSPSPYGGVPEAFKQVLVSHRLAWVGADGAGNHVGTPRRFLGSLLALVAAQKELDIDQSRIYLAGFSGGGRVASMMMREYPDVFDGAIFFSGVNYWRGNDSRFIEKLRQKRFVFVTGSKDFNLRDTRTVFKKFRKRGIDNSVLFDIKGLGHDFPNESWFRKAVVYLDCSERFLQDCPK
jgi:hypothetical protein